MPLKFNSLKINYKAVFNGENHRILVGQVAKINKEEGSCRVKCLRLSLDPKLLKYWSYRKHYWASNEMNSTEGDIVVITQLPKPMNQVVTHRVSDMLYKCGAVVDPLTGKLCHGTNYAEDISSENLDHYLAKKNASIESEV